MKIIYLLDQCSLEGGIQRVISLKANYLVKKGYDVYVVSCTTPEEHTNPFFYWDPRIKIVPIGTPSVKPEFQEQVLLNLARIFDKIKPDIVISTGLKSLKYAASVKDGSKKIIEYHFTHYKQHYWLAGLEKNRIGRALLRLLFRKSVEHLHEYDRIVVLTGEDQKSRKIYTSQKIEVIPNPISFQVAEPSPLSQKRIIAIGRISSQKDFQSLIRIWAKVEKEYPDWLLTIYGQGRKKVRLDKLIKKYHLQNRIQILPPTSKIKEEIINSSIFCMTSRYEGLPLVLLEAIACGVPPVTFAFKCGPRDIIRNGVNGFYVERGDHKHFIRHLTSLMDNEDLRRKIGKAAYEESNNYQIEKIMPHWEALFEELVQEKNLE
ncbi:MAG: glycosyltransferase family 4 protein [Tannerellaceae bacterium]|nr:glycosyltransferase family 4 protein [Tannerellaceae bacterium]